MTLEIELLMPINNQLLFNKSKVHNMGRTIFVKEIITILKEPKLCPTCEKEDRLERDVIREERSDGKTILCTRCEALIVVTNLNLRQVELSSRKDDTIMLKEPHLIRKVAY